MITIDEQLKVTREWNIISSKYVREKKLPNLLQSLFFNELDLVYYQPNDYFYSFKEMQVEAKTFRDIDFYFDFQKRVRDHLNQLDRSDLFSFFLQELNLSYEDRFNNLLEHGGHTSETIEYDSYSEQQFGREIAYKLYEPYKSGLYQDMEQRLIEILCRMIEEVTPHYHESGEFEVVEKEVLKSLINFYLTI